MKINLDAIKISSRDAIIERVDDDWHVKTDGPSDHAKPQGSYLILKADGTVYRRTLDADGYIIHEIKVR